MQTNPCLATDSYKVSHWLQFPDDAEQIFYYVESRGGKYDEIIVDGVQYLANMLEHTVITKDDVEEAREYYNSHFGSDVFNYDGFMRIVNEFDGNIPITMWALPTGTITKSGTPLAGFVAPKGFRWLVGFYETFILRSIWYPTTVASKSYACKKHIKDYLQKTSDLSGDEFDFVLRTRLHDFGARGATCSEAAAIGGSAHLLNFIGTDTVESFQHIKDNYIGDTPVGRLGISVPAREHSTTVTWVSEYDAFENSVNVFGKGIYSVVMDSYDYEAAVDRICEPDFVDKIKSATGTFVIRPDSGDGIENVLYALEKASKAFGYEVNNKGYTVLNPHIRIILGDGINDETDVSFVLKCVATAGYSTENLVLGMGGGLLQQLNRDTLKFAMKASAVCRNGEWQGVSKLPKGAEWKASKKGLVAPTKGGWDTVDDLQDLDQTDYIKYYDEGRAYVETFEEARKRSNF